MNIGATVLSALRVKLQDGMAGLQDHEVEAKITARDSSGAAVMPTAEVRSARDLEYDRATKFPRELEAAKAAFEGEVWELNARERDRGRVPNREGGYQAFMQHGAQWKSHRDRVAALAGEYGIVDGDPDQRYGLVIRAINTRLRILATELGERFKLEGAPGAVVELRQACRRAGHEVWLAQRESDARSAIFRGCEGVEDSGALDAARQTLAEAYNNLKAELDVYGVTAWELPIMSAFVAPPENVTPLEFPKKRGLLGRAA